MQLAGGSRQQEPTATTATAVTSLTAPLAAGIMGFLTRAEVLMSCRTGETILSAENPARPAIEIAERLSSRAAIDVFVEQARSNFGVHRQSAASWQAEFWSRATGTKNAFGNFEMVWDEKAPGVYREGSGYSHFHKRTSKSYSSNLLRNRSERIASCISPKVPIGRMIR
jgi:hypothetical protein